MNDSGPHLDRDGAVGKGRLERVAHEAVVEAERAERQRAELEHERTLQLADALRSVPAKFRRDARFDDPRLSTWVRDVEAVKAARGATGTAVLLGPSGAGRTTLAVCILGRVIDAGRPLDASHEALQFARGARFVSVRELAFARSTGGARYGEESRLVDDATLAPLLVLDDIGQDPIRADSAVPDVVLARYDDARPTIYNSALSEADIRARYGDGFTRRVFDGEAIDVGLTARR